jgi:hypothetical protein
MSTPPAAASSPRSEKSPAKNTGKNPAKSPSKSPPQQAPAIVENTGVFEPEHWQQLAVVRLNKPTKEYMDIYDTKDNQGRD